MALGTARERRRFLIDMALRRARPGTGSSMAFYGHRDWTPLGVDLSSIKTPFALVGANATRLYMPERATDDVDLFVHVDDRQALANELETLGFARRGEKFKGRPMWQGNDGTKLDVIESDGPWVRDAIASALRAPDGSPVIPLPYLVLLKFGSSSSQDIGDLSRMIGLASLEELTAIRQAVATHQPEDLIDLEDLITLGEREFGVRPGNEQLSAANALQ